MRERESMDSATPPPNQRQAGLPMHIRYRLQCAVVVLLVNRYCSIFYAFLNLPQPILFQSVSRPREKVKPVMLQLGNDYSSGTIRLLPNVSQLLYETSENSTIFNSTNVHDDEQEQCISNVDWDTAFHPGCVPFHEIDLGNFFYDKARNESMVQVVGKGYVRNVWMIRGYDGSRYALKTIRLSIRDLLSNKWVSSHRLDAVVHAQLSRSEYIAPIYGFCMNSELHDFSSGVLWDLFETNGPHPSQTERIRIAHRVASAVADLHSVDSWGRASVAMTDVKPDNIFMSEGGYVLSDFNRARFLKRNKTNGQPCPFAFRKNGGRWRSPEEYRYEPLTEKIDIYSMGLVFFFLFTGVREPYGRNMKDNEIAEYVAGGGRPRLSNTTLSVGTSSFRTVMVRVVEQCLAFNPAERPSARQVADDLRGTLRKLGQASDRRLPR